MTSGVAGVIAAAVVAGMQVWALMIAMTLTLKWAAPAMTHMPVDGTGLTIRTTVTTIVTTADVGIGETFGKTALTIDTTTGTNDVVGATVLVTTIPSRPIAAAIGPDRHRRV